MITINTYRRNGNEKNDWVDAVRISAIEKDGKFDLRGFTYNNTNQRIDYFDADLAQYPNAKVGDYFDVRPGSRERLLSKEFFEANYTLHPIAVEERHKAVGREHKEQAKLEPIEPSWGPSTGKIVSIDLRPLLPQKNTAEGRAIVVVRGPSQLENYEVDAKIIRRDNPKIGWHLISSDGNYAFVSPQEFTRMVFTAFHAQRPQEQ